VSLVSGFSFYTKWSTRRHTYLLYQYNFQSIISECGGVYWDECGQGK
jgi:hypothetical protein